MNKTDEIYKSELIAYCYELRDGKIISKKQFERMIQKILDRYGGGNRNSLQREI